MRRHNCTELLAPLTSVSERVMGCKYLLRFVVRIFGIMRDIFFRVCSTSWIMQAKFHVPLNDIETSQILTAGSLGTIVRVALLIADKRFPRGNGISRADG